MGQGENKRLEVGAEDIFPPQAVIPNSPGELELRIP